MKKININYIVLTSVLMAIAATTNAEAQTVFQHGLADSGTYSQNSFDAASSTGINSCFCFTSPVSITSIGLKGALKEIQIVSGNGTTTVNYPTGIKHFTWSVEYPKGTVIYQGRWLNNGNVFDLGVLGAGGSYDTGLNDIGNTIPAGKPFWIRTYIGGLTGSIPTLRKATGSGLSEAATSSNGEADGTMIAAHPGNNGNLGWVADAIYTSATSQPKSITVLGDSISGGFQDHYESYGSGGITGLGWFGRAFGFGSIVDGLNGNYTGMGRPAHRWSAGGRTLANLLASGAPIYDSTGFASSYSNAIIALGRNDCNAGISAATTESNIVNLVGQLQSAGCSVFVSTITPYASSTDNFLTTGSQTPINNSSTVQAVNAWMRSNTSTYNYTLLDLASLIESGGASSPSGVFNAPGASVYSGTVTTGGAKNQFYDTSANFTTIAEQYRFVRWKTGANAGLAQEILTVNSTHQLTCGTNLTANIAVGDMYDVYTRWCAIDNGNNLSDQGEHPSGFAYSYMAQRVIASGLFADLNGGYSPFTNLANVLEGLEPPDSIRVFRLP